MTWRPLVDDAATRATIRAVLVDLAAAVAANAPAAHELDAIADQAILRAYLAADDTVGDPDDAAGASLAAAIARFGAGGHGPALYGGLARMGWTIAHVAGGEDAEVACALFDETLGHLVDDWRGDYDLIMGLVGFGVYALERGPSGRTLAGRVLAELERRARPHGGGRAWHTDPELLHPDHRASAPDGYWNLGLAHGIPGVIALLARFVAAGIAPARSRALLDDAVAFLIHAEPARAGGRYPSWQPAASVASSRLAWCYGDLSVASALLGAALHVDQPAWRTEALELARDCAARSHDDAKISDAAICHGAGGIAHLFHRMARATQDDILAAAARTWIDRALALRSGEGLAGFSGHDASMLTGAAGIGLVLHAAISEVEPSWDRLLLVDLPAA